MKIKKISHPDIFALRQARLDQAIITGQPYIERPHYYEHVETGQQYYELFGCIGWPNVITDKNKGPNRPGYLAIVGVIKGKRPIEAAPYRIMAEVESHNIVTLFIEMVKLRAEYGFGLYPGLLQTWFGDSNRFIRELALFNEGLRRQLNKDNQDILISPPDDFNDPKVFDLYVRSISQAVDQDNQRLYYGGNTVLKNRVREFQDKDPVIIGIGGLIHSLSSRMMWMDQTRQNVFTIEEVINGQSY